MDLKRLFPILLVIFTNILGSGVIMPILPLYAEGQFGGTILQVTLLSTAFFAAQFFAAPWLGRLSDRVGRRPVLLISQLGTILAFILFIFAEPLGRWVDGIAPWLPLTGGMTMLYVARILDGITGGNITTAQAYVSDITEQEHRAHGLGLLQGAFGMGFVFGPAFGGVLANYGSNVPFIGAAIITSITFLLTYFSLVESLPREGRIEQLNKAKTRLTIQSLLKKSTMLNILGVTFFSTLAFSALPATFALFAERVLFAGNFPPVQMQLAIGLMLTLYGLMTVITQFVFLGPLVQRLGERRALLLGNVSLMLAMLAVGIVTMPLLTMIFFIPFAFGQGVNQPNLQALMTRLGGRTAGGQLLGIYQSSRSLALIFGPIWAGFVFEHIGPRFVYIFGSGIMLVATILALLLNIMAFSHQAVESEQVRYEIQ
jgi:DHA1 family tetracycline resistance protein-like MFS transporter